MDTQHRKLIAAMSLCLAIVVPNIAPAAAVSGQGTWETTLQPRDLDGNPATTEAYYDTALNITWLADTNYAQTSGYDADGLMTWFDANAWAASLTIGGYSNWRLPGVNPVDGTTANDDNISNIGTEDWGYNVSAPGTLYAGSTASELAHLFYITLGDKSRCNPTTSTVSTCDFQSDFGPTNTGPFSNFPFNFSYYWSATGFVPGIGFDAAWVFYFNEGAQLIYPKYIEFNAWAVHSGDVGVPTVPVPAAVNTGYRMPTANRPDGGGDRNGYEFYPSNAYVADGVIAEDIDSGSDSGTSCISACKDKHRFYNFGFNIPAASHITGLEVRLKANADSTSGSPRIFVQVSWDGGVSWTTRKKTKVLGTVLTNYKLGTSTDTWGRTWSANDFTDANFRVRLIDGSSDITSDFSLDSVEVRVTYY